MPMPTRATIHARAIESAERNARVSERMFEPQKWNEAFAAECQIEPADECPVAVQAETDPIGGLDVGERERATARRHFAHVDEERAVEHPPRFPAVFRRDEHAV